ncbi:MAG TPA: glycosyltransferase family 2 protein [Synergistaceae bacterium]|nr:glycosyltransferase family 2 protein [Synergistaceae bacterium]HPJ26027.1 glycosyltransferase family 2 protein [Synergistaceae bacterium]
MHPVFSIIVPFLNEEEVLPETCRRLVKVMEGMGEPFELLFIDDGSTDGSAALMDRAAEKDERIRMISFSRNFGQQAAVMAGLERARGEAVVIIDADLQDPPEVIPRMAEKWRQGYSVVYGQREKRKKESFFKKFTSRAFYRILNLLCDIPIPLDTGDFRLMDRKVRNVLCGLREHSLFFRGLVSWVGFRQTKVTFVREGRFAGETKYPLRKMINLSLDAITSFSYKPLRLAGYLGFFLSGMSFLMLLYVVWEKLFTDRTVQGWSSLMTMSLFFHGMTLILLGILGEYIARIYEETKNRPRYIVERETPAASEREA